MAPCISYVDSARQPAVDGALGAELLSAFRGFVENPVTALA